MLARFVLGAAVAVTATLPAMAGQMNAEEAKRFVSGKVFTFTCFDGTRGAGAGGEDGARHPHQQERDRPPVRRLHA